MNLLIVDGDPNVRGMVRAALQSDGHVVSEVGGAADAIHYLSTHPVELVITDLYLPRMDGIDLLHYIAHSGPSQPKVIAMIGEDYRGRDATLAAASLLGARSVLCKPFTGDQLRRAMGEVADKRKEKRTDPAP